MTQAEERFAHLLQPIRDLATNWNIKIANELDEYLVRGDVVRQARSWAVSVGRGAPWT